MQRAACFLLAESEIIKRERHPRSSWALLWNVWEFTIFSARRANRDKNAEYFDPSSERATEVLARSSVLFSRGVTPLCELSALLFSLFSHSPFRCAVEAADTRDWRNSFFRDGRPRHEVSPEARGIKGVEDCPARSFIISSEFLLKFSMLFRFNLSPSLFEENDNCENYYFSFFFALYSTRYENKTFARGDSCLEKWENSIWII